MVNIASRLEALAEPDSIYISQATYALIQDLTECTFVDNIAVKGIHYSIEVYRLTGMKGEAATSTSLLQPVKNGFLLREICFDPLTTTRGEMESLMKALRSAAEMVERIGQGTHA